MVLEIPHGSEQMIEEWVEVKRQKRGMEALETRQLLAGDLVDAGQVGRIVGGQTEQVSYGWVASLQDGLGHFCGGTLVSPTSVVTAAHCVEGQSTTGFSVVLGRNDLTQADGQRIAVERIISHPEYDTFTNDSDIAILRLSAPANELPLGYLSEFNASLAASGSSALALGWGATREGGSTTNQLRSVTLPIVSNAVANASNAYAGAITAKMLAAGEASGGIDTCQGDSGGPLVVFDSNQTPHLAGIVSWGEGCARPHKYGIYTRVTEFADWITANAEVDSPRGTIDFSASRYLTDATATLSVRDSDLAGQSFVDVQIRAASGDSESLRLTAVARGQFQGEFMITEAPSSANNGVLEVAGAESMTATYVDADDGTGVARNVQSVAQLVVDDFPNSKDNTITISAGETFVGSIDVIEDRDWFRLELPENSGYEIQVELEDGTLNDSVLSLYAADGETLLAVDDDGGRGLGSQTAYFASEPKTIYIEVAGYGSNIGSYFLRVEETSFGDDDHFDVFSLATPLAVGDRASGRINTPRDEDWFQFEAEVGVLYRASVDLRTLGDSTLRLVDQDGRTELRFNDDRSPGDLSSRVYFFLSEPGTYFLEVQGYQGELGTYVVELEQSDDDHGNLPADATAIGELSTAFEFVTGEITEFDEDWFSWDAIQGQFYEFETVFVPPPSGLLDTRIELYDPTGEVLLVANDDHLDRLLSRLTWQAAQDDTYYIRVLGFGEDVGDYELEYRQLSSPPTDDIGNLAELAHELTLPGRNSGRVDYEGDLDWFRFSAVRGYDYRFDVSLGSLSDSVLRLVDAAGQTLVENDDVTSQDLSSVIEWTAPASGEYFLLASGYDGQRGTYRITSEIEGDVNLDGRLDAADLEALQLAVRDQSVDDVFDLSQDGTIDAEDVDVFVQELIGTVRGDTNLDGTVDFADFLALSASFTQSGGWGDGDFDGDGMVAFADFLTLSRNFGTINEVVGRVAEDFMRDDDALLAWLAQKEQRIKDRQWVNPK